MTKKPKAGERYRHVERGTTYTVVGTVYATIWDKFDSDTHWLVVRKTAASTSFKLMRPAEAETATNVVLRLPVTVQRSKHRDGQKATDFVIYRAESDNTLWVRALEEFLDGRFWQIVK